MQPQLSLDEGHELVVGDEASAHAFEMVGAKLAVDEPIFALLQMLCQRDEGHLGGIGSEGAHALAAEGASHLDAIETADEGVVVPNFYAVCHALGMELEIGREEMFAEPATSLAVAPIDAAAAAHDAFEILVEGDTIFPTLEELAHGVGDVNVVGKDDETLWRTPPEGLLLVVVGIPLEDALSIAREEPVGGDVATDGQQTVVGIGGVWVGKGYCGFVEIIDHASMRLCFGLWGG